MKAAIRRGKRVQRHRIGAVLVLITCLAWPVLADRYVSPSGSNTPPYTSWTSAANSIQDAIDAADPGETVWVDTATYLLGSEILLEKAVRLRGDGGVGTAILDGQDATRCLRVTDSGAQVEAFEITGGKAVEGGGVYLEAGMLADCSVIGNRGYSSGSTGMIVRGGGVYVGGSGIVTNCTIDENFATGNWEVHGGGVFLDAGALVIDCDIISNTATTSYHNVLGAGLYLEGGGEVSGCTISNNVGLNTSWNAYGGGVYLHNDGSVDSSFILNNRAYDGGGAYLYSGGEVTDCTLSNNTAGNLGGGAMLDSGGTLSESDLIGNSAQHGGGIWLTDGAVGYRLLVEHNRASQSGGGASVIRATLTDSIIRGNEAIWSGFRK